MTTKHTPGPLVIHRSDGTLSICDKDGWEVCNCGFAENNDNEANAKLHAAAPELLEALTELVNDFDKSVVTIDPMLVKARAIILKATT